MSRLCTRRWRGREKKIYHQCCKEISPDTSRCARNRSRADNGVTNVFHLPGVGVEGDSSRDSGESSFPFGLEKVGSEGWASFGGVSLSTGAGPNLLRDPNGAKCESFVVRQMREIDADLLSLVPETSRVAGLHITDSKGYQEETESDDKRREDECAEQGYVTNSRFAGRESSQLPWLSHPQTLCHPLSCPVNDTLKVNSEKIAKKKSDPHCSLRVTRTCAQTTETWKRFS